MIIGSFIKSLAVKGAITKAIPIAKKIILGAGKIAVQEATRAAGDKTISSFTKAPKKVEDFVDRKKSEFIQEAEIKADQVFAKQMEILEKKIDEKVIEVENKFDEKFRVIFWLFLVSMFIIMILAGLTSSILFKYFFSAQ